MRAGSQPVGVPEMKSRYRFVLEIRTMDGDALFSRALEPDWEPALQGARLAGLRRLGVWHDGSDTESSVEPVWHEAAGPPIAQRLRVHMQGTDGEWYADFRTNEYFGDTARAIVAARLAAGQLVPDQRVRFAVAAYLADALPEAGGRQRLSAVERPQTVAVREREFGALAARSPIHGEADGSDFDVVLPGPVIDEVCALTEAAGACETGGILIGHLCRDERRNDVGVEVTAQISARHTVGEADRLTFTSETWTDVRNAVALRRADELLIGWWHSHPSFSWCSRCPIDRQRVCLYATGFLSADDKALHRSVFPSAFTLALVVTNSANGVDTRLFGWRSGVLRPRGFRVSRDSADRPLEAELAAPAPRAVEAPCTTDQGPTQPDAVAVQGL